MKPEAPLTSAQQLGSIIKFARDIMRKEGDVRNTGTLQL